MIDAVNFARSLTDKVTAVYIDIGPDLDVDAVRRQWESWFPDVKMVVVPSPYRSIVDPLLKFLEEEDQVHNDGTQAVLVLPEIVPSAPWNRVLHNQSASLIKDALLYKRYHTGLNRIIIDVPYHLSDHPLNHFYPAEKKE